MKVIFSGGGTGGHIYPALAILRKLQELNLLDKVLYVGTNHGLESKIVPDLKIPFKSLNIQGFKRSLSFYNLKTIFLFLKDIVKSRKIIANFHPDIVIGTGGYVCAPIVFEAHQMHIPTLIHEQNSVPGITNKFLAHFVDKIAITFPETESYFPSNKVILTGNPRSQEVSSFQKNDILKSYGLNDNIPTVMVVGGSQGADKMNNSVINAINKFNKCKYQILFVTGASHFQNIISNLKNDTINSNIKIVPYVNNMPKILPNLSLIVSRAGATSIAEITALGIPSILIPSPYVTNNHQVKNAKVLSNHNATKIIYENQLNSDLLFNTINYLMNNEDVRKKIGI